jgi:phosphoenolpyruvate carboxykinase (ATP)
MLPLRRAAIKRRGHHRLRLVLLLRPSRPPMVLPHQTPYVTPHILHKHYAQAHDNDQYSNCAPLLCSPAHVSPSVVIGRDLEYFSQAGFDMDRIQIKRNAPVAQLYEDAIRNEGAIISATGALINFSGKKTGRSPKDKRIVYEETSKDHIWWGSVNIKMDERMLLPLWIPLTAHTAC